MVNLPLANLAYKILTCLVPSLIHSPPPSLLPSGLFFPPPPPHSQWWPRPCYHLWQAGDGRAPLWSWADAHMWWGGIWIETDAGEVRLLLFSHVQLFVTPWTVAHKAPLSMGFSRQEYWGGLPFPSSGDLPNLGIKPVSPALQADSLPLEALRGRIHRG